jgi:hypothetical protein
VQIECSSIIDQARLIVEANGYKDGTPEGVARPYARRKEDGVRLMDARAVCDCDSDHVDQRQGGGGDAAGAAG